MEMLWFAIVAAMLTVYAVLDGFDFGAGVLHRFVAKTDEERRTVLAAIGPVWDANEVWLVAAGGVLFMAFPKVYASAFSGFYLPLMIVLWLFILRGIAIESRSHSENPLWREFWDSTFAFASALLAIVLGASLGNVVRGVPVDATGYFAMPLFNNFLPSERPGVLDWYTVLVGAFTLCVLTGHGGIYLAWKTTGVVQERSRALARKVWFGVAPLWILVTLATIWLQPSIFTNLFARPWSLIFVVIMLVGRFGVFRYLSQGRELAAFLCSSAFIVGLLGATLTGSYPYWLRSTLDLNYSLTAEKGAAQGFALQIALVWWTVGITLAGAYFVYLFHSIRGKVDVGREHGY